MMLFRRMFGRTATEPPRPLSQTIDLEEPRVAADPFPWYERLREEGDVVHLARHGFWMVLGHEAAHLVFAHPEIYSSSPYAFVDTAMLSVDPPLHGPVRRLVGRSFGGEALRRLEGEAAELAGRLLRDELEVVSGFARPISRAVAASLLELDEAALEWIARAEDDSAGAQDPFPLLCAAVDAVADRAGMTGRLLREGADVVTAEDARSLVRLLWFASTATTERTISHCVLRLLEDPPLRRRLQADAKLVPQFTEEVLRLNPPENFIFRRAAAASTLAGASIPAGDAVHICLPAANRDPARYEAAGEIRLERSGGGGLSFGSGIHQCVGGPLTRRVVNAAIAALLERAPDLRPLQPLGEVEWVQAMVVRAPRELRVSM